MENVNPDSKEMKYVIKSNFDSQYKGVKFESNRERQQKFQEFKDEFMSGFKEAMQPGYNHIFGERFFEGYAGLGVITCNENQSGIAIKRNYKESGQLALSEKLYKNKISDVKSSPRDRGILTGTVYRNLDSSLSKENHNPMPRGIMVSGGIGTMHLLGVKYDKNIIEKIKNGIGKGQKPLVAEAVYTLCERYGMTETLEGIFGKESKNPRGDQEESILVRAGLINNDLEEKVNEEPTPPYPVPSEDNNMSNPNYDSEDISSSNQGPFGEDYYPSSFWNYFYFLSNTKTLYIGLISLNIWN